MIKETRKYWRDDVKKTKGKSEKSVIMRYSKTKKPWTTCYFNLLNSSRRNNNSEWIFSTKISCEEKHMWKVKNETENESKLEINEKKGKENRRLIKIEKNFRKCFELILFERDSTIQPADEIKSSTASLTKAFIFFVFSGFVIHLKAAFVNPHKNRFCLTWMLLTR